MTFIACRLVPCGAFGHALMFAALIPELLTLCAAPREIQGHSNIVKALGVLGTMTLWQLAEGLPWEQAQRILPLPAKCQAGDVQQVKVPIVFNGPPGI